MRAEDARGNAPILVDGRELDGVCVDGDPHVLGLGVAIGPLVQTAALPRVQLPYLRLDSMRRPTSPA